MDLKVINLRKYNQVDGIYVIHKGGHHNHPTYVNDCYMVAYIAHGSGTLEIESENFRIRKRCFLVRPNVKYRFIPEKD